MNIMSSFSNWCRTCGCEKSESKKLQDIGEFQEIVLLFTKLIVDSLTFNVCEECLTSLNMIQKFAEQCAIADSLFADLKSLEDAKNEELEKEKLRQPVFKQCASDNSPDSKNGTNVKDTKKLSEFTLELDSIEVLETSPQTRNLRLRQKKSVLTSPLSVIQPKILICDLCNKHFKLNIKLQKHMKNFHSTSKTPKNIVKQEKIIVTKTSKLEYICQQCDLKFLTLDRLNIHVDSVHNRNYSCNQCKKSFQSEKTLKNHQKTHTNIRKYDCTTCQKSFSNASCLKSHLDTHSDTSYICPECGLKLNTKRTLRQHMLKHSDFKRFKCNICGSEFKRTKTFKEHLIIHSDLRPYSCMWCDKTFKSGANCRKHKKEAHPIELAKCDASGVKIGVVLPKLEHLM